MKRSLLLMSGLLTFCLQATAGDYAPESRLTKAIYGPDAKLSEQLFAELSASPQQLFWSGYLAYRIAPVYGNADRSKTIQYLDTCIKHSEQLAADSPRKAEAMAFSALCYGQKIGYFPHMAPALGSAAMAAKDTAQAFGADNPHVRLLLAINNLFTPPQWGGNPQHALAELNALAKQLPTDAEWNWLLPDVHAYLAMGYSKQGEQAKAQAALDHAKALAPEYSFVIKVLQPYLLKKQQISKN